MNEHEEHPQESAYDHILNQQSLSVADFKQHLTGPVIAFLLHIIAIPILLTVVVSEHKPEKQEMKIEAKIVEVVKPPEQPPEPPEPPEIQEQQVTDVIIDRPSTETAEVDEVDPAEVVVNDSAEAEAPAAVMMTPNNSTKVLQGIYAGRQSGGRSGHVGRGGGGAGGQRALKIGLKWLADNQNPDGSWGKGHGSQGQGNLNPALTALAMLSFFAYGETPSSKIHGEVVRKGCEKLIEYANAVDGRGVILSDVHQYSHAIVTYALADGAAMTRMPSLIAAMDKSVATLIKGQNSAGSFYYNLKPTDVSDISYAGWCFQALKAAYAAGSKVEGLNEAIDKSIKGIKVNQVKNGAFTYLSKNGRPESAPERYANLTPVGVLCLQLLGNPKSDEVARGVKFITSEKDGALMDLDWKGGKGLSPLEYSWRIYAWYYQTQVFFQNADGKKDEPNWRKWRTAFEKSLIQEQEKDGSWVSPAEKYTVKANSFTESSSGKSGGVMGSLHNSKVYSTALCVMMLEVYYRFLPASQQGQQKATSKAAKSDDALIQF